MRAHTQTTCNQNDDVVNGQVVVQQLRLCARHKVEALQHVLDYKVRQTLIGIGGLSWDEMV